MSNKGALLIAGAILIVFGISAFVPLIEVEYIIEVPVNSSESLSENVFYTSRTTLEAGYYSFKPARLYEGRDYTFSFSTSGIVDAYIFTSNQYTSYSNGLLSGSEGSLRARSGEIEYLAEDTGQYFFVLSNQEWDTIIITRFSCQCEWDEIVTEYETQVITKKITVLQSVLGDN